MNRGVRPVSWIGIHRKQGEWRCGGNGIRAQHHHFAGGDRIEAVIGCNGIDRHVGSATLRYRIEGDEIPRACRAMDDRTVVVGVFLEVGPRTLAVSREGSGSGVTTGCGVCSGSTE